jgi:hypothetical protein
MGFRFHTFQVAGWHFRCALVKEHFHFLLVGILTTPVSALTLVAAVNGATKKFLNTTFIYIAAEPYIGCPCLCPCPPMSMGFKWAWVHPCIQFQIGVKLLGCREYVSQEALRIEASDSERPFICPIQPRLGVDGYYTLHNF